MSKVSFQEEKFEDVIEELKPLLTFHWNELANNKDIRPLDVDFDTYVKLSEIGSLRLFTVRNDGVLVGYASFMLANNPHYKTWKYATCDVYYLDPRFRLSGIGTTMFEEIQSWLKSLGVKSVTVQDKINHSHEEFFLRLGFNLVERTYEKIL